MAPYLKRPLHWVSCVEFGSAVLCTFGLGILLGEVAAMQLATLAELFRYCASIASIILSILILMRLHSFTFYIHSRLTIVAIGFLIVANVANLLAVFVDPIVDILISGGSVLMLSAILHLIVQSSIRCVECGK